jgi:uncharacterized protein YjbI with pentapeptide repeats
MTARTKAQLQAAAALIANETAKRTNTASRVGNTVLDVVDSVVFGIDSGMSVTGTAAANAAALAAALANGGTIDVGPGTFALAGDVVMVSNTHLRMSAGTILDISSAGAVDCLQADGTEGATMALTANALQGATTISLSAPNAATLAQGDWIRVASTAQFDTSDTDSEIGELVEVASVSGTTVTLETPLRGGAYNTADTAVASKITFVENIRISGGRIRGGGTLTSAGSDADCNGVRIYLGRDCVIEQTIFERCDLSGVWLQDCIFCDVLSCDFRDAINDQQAYGVLIDNACQDCSVIGGTSARVRHHVTTGNSTNTKGIPRRITFSSLHCYSTTPARGGSGGDAFDTHAAAEDIKFVDCVSHYSTGAGFNLECPSVSLIGCESYLSTDAGFVYHNESDTEGQVTFQACRSYKSTAEGFRVTHPTRGSTARIKSAQLIGCRVESSAGISYYVANTVSTLTLRNVVLSGCTAVGCTNANASVWLQNVETGKVDVDVSEPTQVAANLIRIRDSKNVLVSGCTLRHVDSSSSAILIYINSTGTGLCTGITVESNRGGGTTPTNLRGLLIDNAATNCRIGINDFQECNTAYQPGTGGHRFFQDPGISANNGDAGVTLSVNSAQTQRWASVLTAPRNVTLPTGLMGLRYRIIRQAGATGADLTIASGALGTIGAATTGVHIDIESDASGTFFVTGF